MKKKPLIQLVFILTLILFSALLRIFSPIPNFSPLSAMCLFAAAHFNTSSQKYLLPLAIIWGSDVFINNVLYSAFFSEFTLFYEGSYWQYMSYLLILILGSEFFRKKISVVKITFSALFSTIIFFLISNFGVWFTQGGLYEKSFQGLITCYLAGLPFLKGTMSGNFFFSVLLFGIYYLAQNKSEALKIPHLKYSFS